MKSTLTSLALVVALLTPQVAFGMSEPKSGFRSNDEIPIHLDFPLKKPLLVIQNHVVQYEVHIQAGDEENLIEVDSMSTLEFIDEITSTVSGPQGTRSYVLAHTTNDGRFEDPSLEGVVFQMSRRGEDLDGKVLNDRVLPNAELIEQLRMIDSLWLSLKFPRYSRLGASFELDLSSLAPLIFSRRFQAETARAELTYEAFDSSSTLATFRGRAVVKAFDPKGIIPGDILLEGHLEIRTHIDENRIDRIHFEGSIAQDGGLSPIVEAELSGTLETEIRTRMATAADSRRVQKPEFRSVLRSAPSLGIELWIPSSWSYEESAHSALLLTHTLGDGGAFITLNHSRESSARAEAFVQKRAQEMKATGASVEVEPVTSPLGPGHAIIVLSKNNDREVFLRIEFYPYKGQWIVYKLNGYRQPCEAALADFVQARKTLTPIELDD